jgi:hypothetical protein
MEGRGMKAANPLNRIWGAKTNGCKEKKEKLFPVIRKNSQEISDRNILILYRPIAVLSKNSWTVVGSSAFT